MNAKLIDGKAISAKKREEIRQKSELFEKETGRKICLAVVLIGNDPASEVYVRNKIRGCEATNIKSLSYTLPATITQAQAEELQIPSPRWGYFPNPLRTCGRWAWQGTNSPRTPPQV